jgi:hypothetical protein
VVTVDVAVDVPVVVPVVVVVVVCRNCRPGMIAGKRKIDGVRDARVASVGWLRRAHISIP